jgi:hypothetical protein
MATAGQGLATIYWDVMTRQRGLFRPIRSKAARHPAALYLNSSPTFTIATCPAATRPRIRVSRMSGETPNRRRSSSREMPRGPAWAMTSPRLVASGIVARRCSSHRRKDCMRYLSRSAVDRRDYGQFVLRTPHSNREVRQRQLGSRRIDFGQLSDSGQRYVVVPQSRAQASAHLPTFNVVPVGAEPVEKNTLFCAVLA